jgi:hypothetical protein
VCLIFVLRLSAGSLRSHGPGGDRINQVESLGVGGAGLVVALHDVAEGSLSVEELDESGFAAAVRVLGGLKDVAGGGQQAFLDVAQDAEQHGVLLPGIDDFAVDAGFGGTGLNSSLVEFPLGACWSLYSVPAV